MGVEDRLHLFHIAGADPENRSWGATEIRGQFPCARRHVRFAFEGKI